MAIAKNANDLHKIRKIFLVMFASISSWSVYSLYTLRKVFYSDFVSYLNITNAQFGDLISIWGLVCMVCYIPGGIIGDKVRMKYLAPLGMMAAAGAIFWFISVPSYNTLRLLFIIYGASNGLIFWSCRYKLIKLSSMDEKEYNRNIGWSYCSWAITGVIMSSLLVFLFTKVAGNVGLMIILFCCAAMNIVLAILGFIFIPKFQAELEKRSHNIWSINNFLYAIKNPGVILSSIAMFFMYSVYSCQYTMTTFLQGAFLASGVLLGMVGTIRNFGVNIVSDPIMGYLGRRFKTTRVLTASSLIMIVLMAIMTALPRNPSLTILVAIIIVVYAFCMNGGYCISSALLTECKVPENIFGTAVGIYSCIGFAPDVIMHPIVGRIMDKCGSSAYTYINILMMICSACAIITLIILMIYLAKKNNKPRI